nr:zinc-binding dehydrogenase [Deltaproteobacteria bacterium]
LEVNIAKQFPLEEVEAAHELSQTGRMTGKIVLLPR